MLGLHSHVCGDAAAAFSARQHIKPPSVLGSGCRGRSWEPSGWAGTPLQRRTKAEALPHSEALSERRVLRSEKRDPWEENFARPL